MSDLGVNQAARARDLRHAEEGDEDRLPRVESSGGPLSIVATTAWFGLVTGLLEVGILAIWHGFVASAVLGTLQMNRNFAWMIPVAHLSIFLVCGLPLGLLAIFRPVVARRAATFLFCALSSFSLLLMVPGLYTIAGGTLAVGLGYTLTRRIEARGRPFQRLVWISLPILLGVSAALGALAYDRLVLEERRTLATLPEPARGAPNVVLIVLDTVRADRLSLYGYGRDTTPNLARLARRGVVFEQARSAAPWTLPSHASLFTGRWPHELHVGGDRPLDDTYPTLAEFLGRHGYATAGFVGNTYFCNSWYGLARGFAHYEDYYEENVIISPGEALRCTALGRSLIRLAGTAYNVRPESANMPKDAARVNRDFLRWTSAHRERPFFAFLNYVDAHDPYLTPAGFDRHFGLKPESAEDVETIRTWHHRRKRTIKERDLTLTSDAYDDCLAYLDDQLGQLFDALERSGTLRDTLVIVTADHGEQFGDHGLYGHGKSLYRGEVHVPLIVVGPSGVPQGRSVAEPISLRDVAATIVDRLGLADESPFPGRSLARSWEAAPATVGPPTTTTDDVILSEVAIRTKVSKNPERAPSQRGPMASLVADGKVYIRDAVGREELYDLADDPAEATNLAGTPSARSILERCRFAFDRHVPGNTARR